MTKRFFLQNQGTTSCHLGIGLVHENATLSGTSHRLIFANTPTGGGSGEGGGKKPEDITLDTLGDDLQNMEGNTLTVEQVTKALNVFNNGDQKAKQKLLDLTQKLVGGTYTASAFESRLPKVTANDNAETPAVTAEKKAKAETTAIQEDIKHVASPISVQVMSILDTIDEVANDNALGENAHELKNEFNVIKKDLETIDELDKKNIEKETKDLQKVFAELPDNLKLDPNFQATIVNMSADHPDFEYNFTQMTAKLNDSEEGKKAIEDMRKIKKEAQEANKKIEEDFTKRLHQFREIMNKMGNAVQEKWEREKAIKAASTATGIDLKPGQKIAWYGLEEHKKQGFRLLKETATIDSVDVLAGGTVMIAVKFIDRDTKKETIQNFSVGSFNKFVDAMDVTEDIETLEALESSIGMNIETGQEFEHETIQSVDNPTVTNVESVIINEIDLANQRIILDHEIKMSPHGTPTSIVSYAEFGKWFKRNEVVPAIKTLEDLQTELRGFNEVQLAQSPRKKQKLPIKAEPGEILCIGQNPDAKVSISDVDEKFITLDDGTKKTYAGFLKLVKDLEIIHYEPTGEEKKQAEKNKQDFDNAQGNPANDNHGDEHVGGHHHAHHFEVPKVGYLSQLWASTYILSPFSLYEIGHKIVEFIKRKLDRGEHGRVGIVGERIFGAWNAELGAEFKGVAQHAENEEVNHHAEHMRTMGLEVVKHEMHVAANRDILKAAITVATEKGAMRWDDPGLWGSMNTLIAKYGPIYENGEPLFIKPENHLSVIEKYLDHWFGQDTFREFRNKGDSSYNSIKSNFKDVASRLETDPEKNGGLGGALARLMYKHVATDEYVNPAEYESYLHAAIENGKLSFEAKIMYLIMGFAADGKGAHGHAGLTMFHPDRMGAIDTMANTFPFTNFFTAGDFPQYDVNGQLIIDPATGKPKLGKIGVYNFKDMMNEYVLPDLGVSDMSNLSSPGDLKPGPNIKRFINEVMSDSPNVKVRIEKAAGDATRWDHDDMDRHVSVLSESLVEQLLGKQGGTRQQVTTPGLKNAYAGFNDYMKIRLDLIQRNRESGDKTKLQQQNRRFTDLMKSFIKFDAILDERARHKDRFTRFSQSDYYSRPGVNGDMTVQSRATESREYIAELARELDSRTGGRYDLSKKWYIISNKGVVSDDEQDKTVNNFGEFLDGALAEIGDEMSVADLFETVGKRKRVSGMTSRSQVKTEVEEENKAELSFKPYTNKEVVAMVSQINELEQKLAKQENRTQAQIKAEHASRLKDILTEVQENRYASKTEDVEILNEYIRDLQGRLNKKEAAERGGQQQGGAQNDNGQAPQAQPRQRRAA